jgi:hypothetical protein
MGKPDFFLVGAPRCGTTSMIEYLRQHPDIFVPALKEPMFFCTDVNIGPGSRHLTWEEYLALFDGAEHQVCGEGSTWYLYSLVAARQIRNFNPDAKIIIMLREPVDFMYSLHTLNLYMGFQDIRDFEQALGAIPDRLEGNQLPKGRNWPPHRIQRSLLYTEAAKFAGQVERYLDEFGKDQVFIILFDDFVQDTAHIFQQTLAFLGVDPDFRPDFKTHNQSRQIRSRFFQVLLWHHIPAPLASFIRAYTPKTMRQSFFKMLNSLNSTDSNGGIDTALQQRLRAQFAPEVERLSNVIERDLSFWGYSFRE